MLIPHRALRGPIAALTALLLATLPVAGNSQIRLAAAATDLQTLITTAEHNTNTARTLVHRDTTVITNSTLTVNVTSRGSEDEVHNREQDYESVNVTTHGGSSAAKKLHYTVDIIFMKGMTYYRLSSTGNKWKTLKGMTFPDPYTGGWKRGRTTIAFPKTVKFQQVSTSGGQTHVRAPQSQTGAAGTVDLWISGGSTPYVVREEQAFHTTTGKSASLHSTMSLGPFNTPMVIQAPSTQGST